MLAETFTTLLRDPAHWEFELFLMVIFDGVLGGLAWPFIKRHFRRESTEHQHDVDLEARIRLLEDQHGLYSPATNDPERG